VESFQKVSLLPKGESDGCDAVFIVALSFEALGWPRPIAVVLRQVRCVCRARAYSRYHAPIMQDSKLLECVTLRSMRSCRLFPATPTQRLSQEQETQLRSSGVIQRVGELVEALIASRQKKEARKHQVKLPAPLFILLMNTSLISVVHRLRK
jgi:hypothetical protein